ncbi:[FeFe] hydrogenase H-cluster radical SAM maturase HydG [candidate division WOR-1 bacterium RIFOXYA12_FULL_52_29]|uniref:[FeFe] hydrogenase H-cluster radical SAM maturase HydG n=1 Tax=candidate division WOR-1 bacterium RIFOXYC12_FULL_54_18 TaxID=1802584 RepID=A0A1F4T5I8_UNCSA|nr:MAG: [FeFe] hydrogenase H-cluster radical SAM maturase HydG [candidate division WOR-1 bacterium RIFOXYA2_FULL_51_19]OGC17638.1 MAG: [FeFe] hydrogenase H-cluster radical SAM maturase HydG [candidate division WOR-1 bacterium RIFOXYA12_FULL_52_29]OGC26495.1 MAG: [FeFe] hydrogenase H-cluster radical SAM maturase HydG [candidate division WOR-1 bacterium RIFOXYB2_FULL_45_9]OGC28055.1 MAG: [FeFe] hydrogenase H-cluster radical SAM maturase HydG [candidate division WOR-1 bacterium RIFOXYC12_FULL_54_18
MIINEAEIGSLLVRAKKPDPVRIREILAKAEESQGLLPEETAILLQCEDKDLVGQIFQTARKVKEQIYGKRVVLFAPLYVTNECVNNCLYCGFRKDNTGLTRKTLSLAEIAEEVMILEKIGQKRILMVFGEHPKYANIDFIEQAIDRAYSVKIEKGEIRRINVNLAPLSLEDFKRLKAAKIGTYQAFQETYHRETYIKMHPSGKKADYEWRLSAFDRAQRAGIDDLGAGVLFGLYDYKFEVLALLFHSMHLEKEYGSGPHTISVPRLEPALNAPAANRPPHPVSNDEFKKLVAIIRLAVPYTGLILSTRESAGLRDELVGLGISQISAGSRTYPGGYKDQLAHVEVEEQFQIEDTRPLDQVIYDLCDKGCIPSFCTACYRLGRTGENFMGFAKTGFIRDFCTPNALLTFKEYLLDFASPATRQVGEKVLAKHLEGIEDRVVLERTVDKIRQLQQGKRDLYF